jgi:2,4-diketo-3-deoxy-L-fuconate hydrolase
VVDDILERFLKHVRGLGFLTGTPPGVGLGQKPPVYLRYLRAGQEIRAGVQGLGEQHQRVVE